MFVQMSFCEINLNNTVNVKQWTRCLQFLFFSEHLSHVCLLVQSLWTGAGYLERLGLDEGEEGDGFLHVSPGSGQAGPSLDLTVPELNTELQSHIRRRLPGRSTTTRQGDVEPNTWTDRTLCDPVIQHKHYSTQSAAWFIPTAMGTCC